jgi:hypothetical protein
MTNRVLYSGPKEVGEILMGPCKELYIKNYPQMVGRKISVGEMLMEVVTFYRDAEGFIIRGKGK